MACWLGYLYLNLFTGLVHFGCGNFTAQFVAQNARNIFAKQIKIYIDIGKLLQQISRHSPLANSRGRARVRETVRERER